VLIPVQRYNNDGLKIFKKISMFFCCVKVIGKIVQEANDIIKKM